MLLFDCSDLAKLADVEGREEKILFSPLEATMNPANMAAAAVPFMVQIG